MKVGVLVALVVGIVLGVVGVQVLVTPSTVVAPAVESSVADSSQAALGDSDELIQLRADHEILQEELAETKLALEAAQAEATTITPQASVVAEDTSVNLMEELGEEIEDAALQQMQARRQEWQQRREQWGTEMRERTTAFFEESLANSTDPVEQERLLAMEEYMGVMMDLRGQMRDAETEEEEDALRAAMEENGVAMRELVDEQQQYMLGKVAEDFGIKKPGQQRKLAEAMQQTMESPFFWGGRMFGGGWGGPGGRGGRGR